MRTFVAVVVLMLVVTLVAWARIRRRPSVRAAFALFAMYRSAGRARKSVGRSTHRLPGVTSYRGHGSRGGKMIGFVPRR
jgi:hypothetical protein